MRGPDDAYESGALPPCRHFYVRAEALEAIPFYDLAVREGARPLEGIGLDFRIFEVEVGDALPPDPGAIAIVARTNYLEVSGTPNDGSDSLCG